MKNNFSGQFLTATQKFMNGQDLVSHVNVMLVSHQQIFTHGKKKNTVWIIRSKFIAKPPSIQLSFVFFKKNVNLEKKNIDIFLFK